MANQVGLMVATLALAGLSAGLVFVAEKEAVTSAAGAVTLPNGPSYKPANKHAGPDALSEDDPTPSAPANDDQDEEPSFRVPSGAPSTLTCDEARRILAQVRTTLAYTPTPLVPAALAAKTSDWLDPHGLWSAAPDSPVPAVIDRQAGRLLGELVNEESSLPATCPASQVVGEALVRWTTMLGEIFESARRSAASDPSAPSISDLDTAAGEASFADETRPARQIAHTLGDHAGLLERGLGASIVPYVEACRARFFPSFDAEAWAGVVRAATVRAFVQLTDPHGAWAAHDEEASVYDVDLDVHPPDRLWDDAARTALGVRVESGPMAPLETGDLVLSVADVATAGLPYEQLDQLVYATTDAPEPAKIVVLRPGERALRTLELPAPDASEAGGDSPALLPAYRTTYGDGDALVVEIHDVRSDLGDELAATLRKEVNASGRPVLGLLLDLRGDGGGSTEGVIAAIGLFLPGAPLFPMARRDGSIEVDRAPEPPVPLRWTGPVATLVDGDTASAAEMLAGALRAYRRGPVVGFPTYGKGCAQEYLDDDADAGVLRLTTLLYALPDGSPVQGVGLEPSLLLPPRRSGSRPIPLANGKRTFRTLPRRGVGPTSATRRSWRAVQKSPGLKRTGGLGRAETRTPAALSSSSGRRFPLDARRLRLEPPRPGTIDLPLAELSRVGTPTDVCVSVSLHELSAIDLQTAQVRFTNDAEVSLVPALTVAPPSSQTYRGLVPKETQTGSKLVCQTDVYGKTTCEEHPIVQTVMVPGPVEVFTTKGKICAPNANVIRAATKGLRLDITTPTAARSMLGFGHGSEKTSFRWAFAT